MKKQYLCSCKLDCMLIDFAPNECTLDTAIAHHTINKNKIWYLLWDGCYMVFGSCPHNATVRMRASCFYRIPVSVATNFSGYVLIG